MIQTPLFLFVSLLLVASTPHSDDPILATLGTTEIRRSDFHAYVKGIHPPEQEAGAQKDPKLLEAYLDLRALAAKARSLGIEQEERFQKAREMARRGILVAALRFRDRERLAEGTQATEAEVKASYDRQTEEFRVDPNFTARQVLVYVQGNTAFPEKGLPEAEALAKAKDAKTKLESGLSWETVARAYSQDPSTWESGGLMERVPFGNHPPELERAVREQPLGIPGEPVRTLFGYHVISVEDRKLEGLRLPFEQVQETLRMRLVEDKRKAAFKAYVDHAKAEVGFRESPEAGMGLGAPDLAQGADPVLATLGGLAVRESDFQWHLKHLFVDPIKRREANAMRGARRRHLEQYLEGRILEAEARKEGLEGAASFVSAWKVEELNLLAEFTRSHDKVPLAKLPGRTEAERSSVIRTYCDSIRKEMDLRIR